jgi:hypothetical protein
MTKHERLRIKAMLEAVVARIYELDDQDLKVIFKDCDHPEASLRKQGLKKTLDPKGFWRVDQDKDPELRHTVLTLAAFRDLKAMIEAHGGDREKGIEAFCNQNDGEGWMLPETLCLADLGLGHDERAKTPQPVRARLGERFLPWQLEQSAEDSWKECELHARNLLGEAGFARLQAELRGEIVPDEEPVPPAQPEAASENGDDFELVPGAPLKKKGKKTKDPVGQKHMF